MKGRISLAVVLIAATGCGAGEMHSVFEDGLPAEIVATCGATQYSDPTVEETVKRLGYDLGSPDALLNSLSPYAALTLCALGEGPLESGDTVVRFLRMAPWPDWGRSYVTRLDARGRSTRLEARVLSICRHDSLLAHADTIRDEVTGELIYMPEEIGTPGTIDHEVSKTVPRRLLQDVLAQLEEIGFWQSEGQLPPPDGYMNFIEVQLGARYRVVHLGRFSRRMRGPLPRLVSEVGLGSVECEKYEPFSDHSSWLVDTY